MQPRCRIVTRRWPYSGPSFRRSRCTCTSTVRLLPWYTFPQTLASKCARVNARPERAVRNARSSNSRNTSPAPRPFTSAGAGRRPPPARRLVARPEAWGYRGGQAEGDNQRSPGESQPRAAPRRAACRCCSSVIPQIVARRPALVPEEGNSRLGHRILHGRCGERGSGTGSAMGQTRHRVRRSP